jgi:GDSL-like Lipase/Acylhydrolase family
MKLAWLVATSMVVGIVALGGAKPAARPPVAQQDASLFEWSIPAQFGTKRDANGRIIEADASEVREGPWTVRFQVAEAVCASDAAYRWRVDDRDVEARRAPGCLFEIDFPAEGRYAVTLNVKSNRKKLAQTQDVMVEDWLIVSIGDSVASGEGVPDVPGFFRAEWQSVRCHRSARAGAAKAAARIEDQDDHTSVTFIHLACSGAGIDKGLLGSYGGVLRRGFPEPLPPQVVVLNELAEQRPVDAVLISIGANDVYFEDMVWFCTTRLSRNCFEEQFPGTDGKTLSDEVSDALERLLADYGLLADAISSEIPPSSVYIVDYFDPTHDAKGRTCQRILGGISDSELELAQTRILGPLNNAITTAAEDNGWSAITGMAARFRKHGYCAGRQSWVTSLFGSLARLGGKVRERYLGTLHPNEAGHDEIGDAIATSLGRSFYPGQALKPRVPSGVDGGLSTVAIAAIAVAGAFVLALLGAFGWLLGRRGKVAS